MSPPVLRVEGLRKHFGAIAAVDGASLEVSDGEILGIIGPNGSGKSTLFNCILGQLRPDTGRVWLREEEVTGHSPEQLARRGLARTFQLLQVFPGMTVTDNLIAAAQEHRGGLWRRLVMPPDAGLGARATHMLERFGLAHLARAEAGSLSYGQQKLLDLAMALMAQPSLALLDEPAGGVNPRLVETLRELLVGLNRERRATFVVIEHNMDFVMRVSHRIVVLAGGRVLAEGPPERVRADPRVIEAYLGE